MFCPVCGRDNSTGRKFCASCGTNLEAVSQALSGNEDDFFTRLDSGLDHFLARYAEHVFKNAPAHALEQRVGKSWKVLGQSVITSLVDILLFTLMWNVIPLRFILLLISSPIRLLGAQGRNRKREDLPAGGRSLELAESEPRPSLTEAGGSVTEHTTVLLTDTDPVQQKRPSRR